MEYFLTLEFVGTLVDIPLAVVRAVTTISILAVIVDLGETRDKVPPVRPPVHRSAPVSNQLLGTLARRDGFQARVCLFAIFTFYFDISHLWDENYLQKISYMILG